MLTILKSTLLSHIIEKILFLLIPSFVYSMKPEISAKMLSSQELWSQKKPLKDKRMQPFLNWCKLEFMQFDTVKFEQFIIHFVGSHVKNCQGFR